MPDIGLWAIGAGVPKRLLAAGIDLEKDLETWIEQDPGLLRPDLTIVGRQLSVEGGYIDLLALDPQGRFVVIEIKSGSLHREVIAQAIDYASCIASMPFAELAAKVDAYLAARMMDGRKSTLEEMLQDPSDDGGSDSAELREVEICVVGTGRTPRLERMVDYLANHYGVPVSSVVYQVFQTEGGQRVLVRQLAESELAVPSGKHPQSVDDILLLARANNAEADFRAIHGCAVADGLYSRPYKYSIMYTHPSDKTRMLFTVWVRAPKLSGLKLWLSPKAFGEFYGVPIDEAVDILGQEGPQIVSPGSGPDFAARLGNFFARVSQSA